MLGLLSKTWRPLLILLVALAFFLGAYFFFYRGGGYDAPSTVQIPFERISMPSSSVSSFTEVPPIRKGTLLVDGAHSNEFIKGEVSVLLSRVTDRGYTVEFLGEPSRFGGFRRLALDERLFLLDEKLRGADSFAVILPDEPYDREEVDMIERYVRKGGKLLLIADPARDHQINTLSERFGISFQPDYLYNVVEHDVNFQNIFIKDFRPDEITRGLGQIVLYTAGSIQSSEAGIAFTDGNTRSSMVDRPQLFYPLVKGSDGRVLAIFDLTFMIPPQNSIVDNDRLVSNIADYLTSTRREFELSDFPHFFKGDVDILLGRSALLDMGAELKNILSASRIVSELRSVEDLTSDTVFIGLYEDSPDVAQYLEVAGIQVSDTLRTPFTHAIAIDGTAIILLHRTQQRHVLIVLGDSQGALADAVRRLESGQFRSGLVSEVLGIY